MASQHDPPERAAGINVAASDEQQRGGSETSLVAALKADHRLRRRVFAPLFVALLAFAAFWNRVTDPHFPGLRPIDGLRMLAVVLGLGVSLTTLWRFFAQRRP